MKTFSLLAAVFALGLTLGVGDAEAAKQRLGAGKASGMQRQATPPAKASDAAPAAKPAAPANATAPAAGAPTAAAQTGRSWMGPVAGLAAGLGLAALASHFGFGEELASFMMMALIGLVVVAAVGFFLRRRMAAQQPALAAVAGPLQYAGQRPEEPIPAPRGYEASPSGASAGGPVGAAANIPADFDAAGFVRNAKVHFIRLQAANDAGNLDDIREFTTPEMFAELKMNLGERGDAGQTTDVVTLDAEVIDVAEERHRYVVSVRFAAQIREGGGPAEAVDEIWHLVKPRDGDGGWRLAGIQQP